MNAITDEDKLDREATRQVIRRSWHFAQAVPPHDRSRAGAGHGVWTATTLAGPVLVSYGIDHGISAGSSRVLNNGRGRYIGVTILGLQRGPVAVRVQSTARVRGSCATCASGSSITCSGRAWPIRPEKTGVLVSRMTADVESMGELIQFGLLQSSPLRCWW